MKTKTPFIDVVYMQETSFQNAFSSARIEEEEENSKLQNSKPSFLALPLSKVQFAGYFGASILVCHHSRSALQIHSHLVFSGALVLARQVILAGGLGLGVPPAVLEHLPRGDALLRVQGQRLHEQVDAVGAHDAEAHLVPVPSSRGVLAWHGVLWESGDAGPVVFCGGADGFANHLDLVELVVAGHVRRTQDELCEDGSDGPDVHCAAVVPGTEEQFGGSIPAGDDVGCHVAMGVGEASRKAEIGKLHLAVGGNEQVVWFDIAM